MGLPTLELEFEQHNPQNQMVVSSGHSTNKRCSKGRIARDRDTSRASTPETQGQTKSAPSSKRKSSKATKQQQDQDNQAQTKTAESESEVTSEPIVEPETIPQPSADPETTAELTAQTKTKLKPAAKCKSADKTPTRRKSAARKTKQRQDKGNQAIEEPQSQSNSEPTAEIETDVLLPAEAGTIPQALIEVQTNCELTQKEDTTSEPATKRKPSDNTQERG